jgi:hypothetical protein
MSDWLVKDTDRGATREVKSRSEAEEVADDLRGIVKQSGGDPDAIEIVAPDAAENSAVDGREPDGGETTKQVEQSPDSVQAVRDARGEIPDTSESVEADTLPDRELTDDPIEWLQKGNGELTTSIKGTTVITKKGFRVLQHFYDIDTGSDVVVGPEENDHTFCRVKAWAEMPDGRRAEAHASAHVDRGDDHFLLVSMADTRAKSRALSDVTGVGAVAIEEMSGVDTEN